MSARAPLIIGIDPGTHTAVAIIDTSGNVVLVHSEKEFGLSEVIRKVIEAGIPVIVGTDKANTPGFIEEFSSKTGARIIHPREDLTIEEKRGVIAKYRDYIKLNNDHEKDALASALFAFSEIRQLLIKLDSFIERNKKQVIANELKFLVISKGISMKSALEFIEKPDEEDSLMLNKVIEKKVLKEEDFLRLYSKLKSQEFAGKFLSEKNKELEKELHDLKTKNEFFKEKLSSIVSDRKAKDLVYKKEQRLVSVYGKIEELASKNKELAETLRHLNLLVSSLGKNILLKKLDNLGWNEFEKKNKILNIQNRDILLVDNPNIITQKTVDALKSMVEVIVCKQKISPKLSKQLKFIFINADKLNIEETEFFAVVPKQELEKEKNNASLLNKIIEDYREGRDL